jgi:Tfp pilus assembly protein PilF
MLGFVYMSQKEIAKAIEMCEIALEIDSNFELAKGNLAYLSSIKE